MMENQSRECCGVVVFHLLRRFAPFQNSGKVFSTRECTFHARLPGILY